MTLKASLLPIFLLVSLASCQRSAEKSVPTAEASKDVPQADEDRFQDFLVHMPECITGLDRYECASNLASSLKGPRNYVWFDLPSGWDGLVPAPLPLDYGAGYTAVLDTDHATFSIAPDGSAVEGVGDVYSRYVNACLSSKEVRCKYGLVRAAAAAAIWSSYTTTSASGASPLTDQERQRLADSFSKLEEPAEKEGDYPAAEKVVDGIIDIVKGKYQEAVGLTETFTQEIMLPLEIIGTPASPGQLAEQEMVAIGRMTQAQLDSEAVAVNCAISEAVKTGLTSPDPATQAGAKLTIAALKRKAAEIASARARLANKPSQGKPRVAGAGAPSPGTGGTTQDAGAPGHGGDAISPGRRDAADSSPTETSPTSPATPKETSPTPIEAPQRPTPPTPPVQPGPAPATPAQPNIPMHMTGGDQHGGNASSGGGGQQVAGGPGDRGGPGGMEGGGLARYQQKGPIKGFENDTRDCVTFLDTKRAYNVCFQDQHGSPIPLTVFSK